MCIQELDGSFNHTVQIEDVYSRHELPCHSKSRRLDTDSLYMKGGKWAFKNNVSLMKF